MTSSSCHRRRRVVGLALTSALASMTVSGCAIFKPDEPRLSSNALVEPGGQKLDRETRRAIDRAEQAVLADPRNAELRVALGATYLHAGRFLSAEHSFAEAMELGHNAPDVVVSRALAQIANGEAITAHRLLDEHRENIDPSDLGLAFALAGDTHQGTRLLVTALREGSNTAKTRQNLAYALALAGEWRGARLMVAEDVPADEVGARLQSWAASAATGAHQQRIAALLNVAPSMDAGRPAALALSNHVGIPELAQEAASQAPAPLLAVSEAAPAAPEQLLASFAEGPVSHNRENAEAIQATKAAPAVSQPPQRVALEPSEPARPAARKPDPQAGDESRVATRSPAPAATARQTAPAPSDRTDRTATKLERGDHMVQLGSFRTRERAEQAWDIYTSRYPELAGANMALTEANIDGVRYFRVAAADLAERSAQALCTTVKRSGHSCFAYAKTTRLPGTIARDVRMARVS